MPLECCVHKMALRRTPGWVATIAVGIALIGVFCAPATAGSFLSAAALTTGRYYHTATTLPDGRVLVAGGNRVSAQGFVFVGAAELYDPATDKWTNAGTLAPALAYHAATLLPSGKVLLIGGCEPADAAPPQIYDPATGTWGYAGTTVPPPRLFPTATLLGDGRVLVVGGRNGSYGPLLKTAELFDPSTNTWSTVPSMSRARIAHTATLLASGKVLVTGGLDAQNQQIATAELYDPATNTWSSAGSLLHARESHSATLLPDRTVLVAAGKGPVQHTWFLGTVVTTIEYLRSAEIYAPDSNTWTNTSASDCKEPVDERTEDVDPPPIQSAGALPIPGGLAVARAGHTATLLSDGTVLAVGGRNGIGDSSAETFNAASRTWSDAGTMSAPRELHGASLLKDGRVLIVAGWNEYGVGTLASAEIYAPTAVPPGTFTYVLLVTTTGAGGGTVASTPAAINCGTNCSAALASGTSLTLTATPDASSTFAGWSGACSGTGTCMVTMTAARSVVAMFNATVTLAGTNGNDTLTGTAAGDVISGLGGDDRITGLGGNDAIDGGAGVDTAIYGGPSANYQVEKSGTTWKITDNTGVDGQDTLRSVERIEFTDKTFELTNLPRSSVPAYGRTQDFLFDAVFYLLDNPELVPALSRATAAQHYLATGAAEGRWPNAWFDATYYKNRWPDLTPLNLSNATLFLHYNLYGVWEGRSAGPVFHQFDGNRYLRDNPDVAAYVDAYLPDFLGSRTNGAIAHYVIYGQHELRPAFNVSGQPIQLGYVANLGQ